MGRSRYRGWGRAAAALAALALIAAACGGDDSDGEEATSGTIDQAVKEAAEARLGAEEEEGEDAEGEGDSQYQGVNAEWPDSIEGWMELWAEQRADVVAEIEENGWGLTDDGSKLVGPAGFEIDLTQCPAGWSNTQGLTDTEIKIGHTTALSGTLADYGNIGLAMEALFEHYNDLGGFTDSEGKTREINLIIKDDGYDSARTIPLVDELIDSEKVFAMWTLGSPNTMKTYDKLNQRCIPQPFSQTAHPAWGDPVNHPWTTGVGLAYNNEAVLWGSFIEDRLEEFGGEATVAALVMNNDFGAAYHGGFEAFLDQSENADKIEFITEFIEPSAPTVKDPMTTLASKNPDVFIGMTAGVSCTQMITEAAENGMNENVPHRFIPQTCKSASFVGKDKVGGDGSASDDWWIIGGGLRDFNSSALDDDPYIAWGREILSDAGIDYTASGSYGSGFAYGWPMVQVLQIAGELEGGLNRTNLILAQRTIDMTHPSYLEGIGFNMYGNDDAYFTEGSDISIWDSEEQTFVVQGDIIELSGQSSNCAWDQSIGECT